MTLTPEDLHVLCRTAQDAAREAGRVIRSFTEKEVTVSQKSGGESLASQVVTEADIQSEKIILEILKPTLETYDIAVLAEESSDSGDRFRKDHFWSIDPLDGTLPFTEGRSGFSVSIALVKASGEPLLGVVYDPVNDTLYHAVKGEGAFKNGGMWNVKNGTKFHLICDRSFLKQERYDALFSRIREIAREYSSDEIALISHGGAAMNACWVLEHAPACYFKLPKKREGGGSLWDYAATAAIFGEIGAAASDIQGEPLDLNRRESTFMNHRGVIYASDSGISEAIQSICRESVGSA